VDEIALTADEENGIAGNLKVVDGLPWSSANGDNLGDTRYEPQSITGLDFTSHGPALSREPEPIDVGRDDPIIAGQLDAEDPGRRVLENAQDWLRCERGFRSPCVRASVSL